MCALNEVKGMELSMKDIDQKGIEFLNRLYKDMYKSEDVMHGIDERYIGNKVDNISRYIDRMQDLHERVASSGRPHDLDLLKQFYYRKYVIREEDIPESYFEHQKEIYLERGYGHVEFTEKDKREMVLPIINDQKKSLDVWIDYFVSNDSSYIPMWAKYWAFQGMLSLGNYDKKNKTFSKRSKGTTSPFVDLNREALALSIDFLQKVLNKEEIDDKQLEVLVQGGSFEKIYSYILTKTLSKNNNLSKTNAGKWIKYNRGSDHMSLVKSLQGYNTGWCTAGEATAELQLSRGDFYVYYTYNEKGEAVVPRIAIRMEGNSIGEVRGVAQDQNLESEMEEIAEQKLNEFPDKDEYKKKVSDMKKLTEIYKKYKSQEELSKEDLIFLYEIDSQIEGFGYKKDPRIKEIVENRNLKKDLSFVLGCAEEQIGIKVEDLRRNLLYYYGNLYLSWLTTAEGLELPETINGCLYLDSLTTAEGLKLPKNLNGALYLRRLRTAEGLELPKTINGSLELGGLTTAKGLELPETLNGSLDLSSLTTTKGLKLPETINGNLYLGGLTTAEGLKLPETINGNLYLGGLTTAEALELPKTINGGLNLSSLKTAEALELPKTINGGLHLNSLTTLDGAILPEQFNKIYLANNVVVSPENVHKYVNNAGTSK